MPSDRLYVFDANVIVSALLIPGSVPRRAFDRACDRGMLLLSRPVIQELDDVLRRPHLEKYIREDERMQFLVVLIRDSKLVIPSTTVTDCADPKDNKYLEVGIAGYATCIVSGDPHLLDLHPYRGIPIRTPRQYLDEDF